MNAKNTKKRLVASVLAMAMCFTMFIGSTFAWFTDNATISVNSIQAGTLDIQLLDKDGNNLEGKTLEFADKDGKTDVLIEPGARFRTNGFKIHQNGNLEFKYKVVIAGIDGDAKLLNALEFKLFKLVDTEYKEIAPAEEGRSVDFLGTWEVTFNPATGTNVLTQIAGMDSELMYLEAHMKEDAGNEYQGLKLEGISITVVATQDTVEFDSFDDQYDADASYGEAWDGTVDTDGLKNNTVENTVTIKTAEQLAAFAEEVNVNGNSYAGKTVVLATDIDLMGKKWTPIGQTGFTEFKGVFDGNGHTIYNLVINNTDESKNCSTGLFGWIESHGSEGVTVKNLTVENATVTGNHNVGIIVGYVYGTIENCHVVNATINCKAVNDDANGDKAGCIAGYVGEDATIKNCTAKNSAVSAGRDAGQVVGAAREACVTGCSATNVKVTANNTSTGSHINEAVIGRIL